MKEQQQERVAKAVTAYWWVMHKTFTDNALKAVRDVAVKGVREWSTANGLRAALRDVEHDPIEDLDAIKYRENLMATVALMKKCREDLEKI